MKNEHIPFELIDQIYLWAERSVSGIEEDYSTEKERLRVIRQTINNLKKLSVDVPEALLEEESSLEMLVASPSREKQVMQDIVEKLQDLQKYLKKQISKTKSSRNTGVKAPPKVLCVALPNGEVIIENTATLTYVKTLEYIGLENLVDIPDVKLHGYPVVSKTCNPNARQLRKIGDFYIETHCGTQSKVDILRKYIQILGIELEVTVLD